MSSVASDLVQSSADTDIVLLHHAVVVQGSVGFNGNWILRIFICDQTGDTIHLERHVDDQLVEEEPEEPPLVNHAPPARSRSGVENEVAAEEAASESDAESRVNGFDQEDESRDEEVSSLADSVGSLSEEEGDVQENGTVAEEPPTRVQTPPWSSVGYIAMPADYETSPKGTRKGVKGVRTVGGRSLRKRSPPPAPEDTHSSEAVPRVAVARQTATPNQQDGDAGEGQRTRDAGKKTKAPGSSRRGKRKAAKVKDEEEDVSEDEGKGDIPPKKKTKK